MHHTAYSRNIARRDLFLSKARAHKGRTDEYARADVIQCVNIAREANHLALRARRENWR